MADFYVSKSRIDGTLPVIVSILLTVDALIDSDKYDAVVAFRHVVFECDKRISIKFSDKAEIESLRLSEKPVFQNFFREYTKFTKLCTLYMEGRYDDIMAKEYAK